MSQILCSDVSGGLENIPVSLANDVDDVQLPDFEYTTTNIPGEGACEDSFSEVFQPCKCSACCIPGGCPCWLRSGHPYNNDGCLSTIPPVLPLIECSSLCACDTHRNCTNRIVQMGLTSTLQVFRTRTGKGFGLRTLSPVKQGQYVTSYAGEVLGLDSAKRRVASMDSVLESCYVIVVRENGLITVVVDPSRVGNAGRFLNHSCNPNLVMVPVRTQCVVPELALFAVRDISPLTELCFDYSDGMSETCKEGWKRCCCGDVGCRGWLPFDKDVLGV